MKQIPTIVFIHGYTASHLADWYPAISPLLHKAGFPYIIPDLPGGKNPHAAEWLEVLHSHISQLTSPIVLVGHSLGTRAALLYLEKYRPNIEAVFLIAAFNNKVENGNRRDGETYPDFFEYEIDIESIRPLAKKFVVMHSIDDDSIPVAQGKEIASLLGAEYLEYQDRGHFCEPKNAEEIFSQIKRHI